MYKLLFLILILLVGCKNKNSTNNKTQTAANQEKTVDNSHLLNPLPDSICFAKTFYNLSDIDNRERFDKEITVNTFWHSNTLFYMKRANRWFPLLDSILAENNVPTDFKYLALIESGLTQATSPAGAKGFWQFMPETAKGYNLEISATVDERLHVEKSTIAACTYLKDAYTKFNAWDLAALAYNRGKAGIARDLENQQVKHAFDLYLNAETARYFFRILAAKEILEQPAKYNFNLVKTDLYKPIKTKKILVNENIDDLSSWAKKEGFNLKILKKLNPWLISTNLAVKNKKTYVILLPSNKEKLKPYAKN